MDARAFAAYRNAIQRAEARLQSGEHRAAFDLYRTLLGDRLKAGAATGTTLENGADMVVADRVAYLAVLFGHDDAADNLLEGMAAASFAAGNRYAADYYSIRRVHLALGRGALAEARNGLDDMAESIGSISDITISEKGFEAWEAGCDWGDTDGHGRILLLAGVYYAFGHLLAATGQYGAACTAVARGLVHAGPGAPDLARSLAVPMRLTRARALVEAGDLSAADDELTAVRPLMDAGRHPGHHVEWLELAAKLHMLNGHFGAALRRIEEALAVTRRGAFHRAEVTAMMNLAHIRIVLNQTAAAADLLQAARSAARAAGDIAGETRAAHLLSLARARGQSLAADVPIAPSVTQMWDEYWPEAPAPEEPAPDPTTLPQPQSFLALFEDRALGVQCRLARYDARGARALLGEIRQVFDASDSRLIAARIAVLEGIVAYYHREWPAAERHVMRAAETFRALGGKPELWQALRFLSWTRTYLERPDAALDAEAERLLEDMSSSLEGVDRGIFLLNKWTADEEALAREADAVERLKAAHAAARWFARPLAAWRLLNGINGLMWRIDRHKALCSRRATHPGETASSTAAAEPSLLRRLFGSPRDQATVAFLSLPDKLVITYACGLKLGFGVTPVTRIQLRDAVRDWHRAIGEAFAAGPGGPPAGAQTSSIAALQLSGITQLSALAASLPRRVGHLVIVPDDVLHGVPFGALPHRGGCLVEDFALSVRYESLENARAAAGVASRDALLVGVSRAAGPFPALPGVLAELERVKGVLARDRWNVLSLVDEKASRQAVLSQLSRAAVVHAACHGTFEPDRPDQSGLVLLAGARDAEALTLRELSELDLRGMQHATLSACWSADNFVLPGRWIVSLPETLVRAGARSVMGSLWAVPDATAAAFMNDFYEALPRLGCAAALRQAQLTRLRAAPPCQSAWANIGYWAGFTAYGDGRRIE